MPALLQTAGCARAAHHMPCSGPGPDYFEMLTKESQPDSAPSLWAAFFGTLRSSMTRPTEKDLSEPRRAPALRSGLRRRSAMSLLNCLSPRVVVD